MILYKTKQSEVVRVDGGSTGQPLKKYSTSITGDGIKTVFTIEHNLDTEDILFEMNDGTELIFTDYNVVDNNTVNVIFSIAPTAEENYSVTIYGTDGSNNSSGSGGTPSTAPVTSGVSKIKGSAENEFRTGDVVISPRDIGLGNVDNTSDSEKNVNSAVNDNDGNRITDTYAIKRIYGDDSVSFGRKEGTVVGEKSFAFGDNVEASGESSYAEGWYTTASNAHSHAENNHATASGPNSHAEGGYTTSSGVGSHAENAYTTASGFGSHAEGGHTTAGGQYSHAEGFSTVANGKNSHASGYETIAKEENNFACGIYNVDKDILFSIGNGIEGTGNTYTRSNAFSVSNTGVVKAKSTITSSTTADYAEFFEWEDGNPDNEDRVGKFVTMNGDKISIATSNEDYILGIVSGEPFVLGNGDCDTWNGMYLKDDFNRTIYEEVPKTELQENENGEITKKEMVDENGNKVYEMRPKLNPEYDSSQVYVSRFERPEWLPVGMLGVLSVWQDGSLEVNGYCCCNTDGIATSCDDDTKNSYRVIQIISDSVAKVILK